MSGRRALRTAAIRTAPAILLAWLEAAPARAASEGGSGAAELVWTAVNLVVLLAVLFYFGRKPVRAFFHERRDRVQRELREAEELRREVEARLGAWQRKLSRLDEEVARLRGLAREQAEAERERILADARAAAGRIERDAAAVIDQELRRSREELRREAAELTVRLAGELLARQVSEADRARLVDEFIESVERDERSGTGAGR